MARRIVFVAGAKYSTEEDMAFPAANITIDELVDIDWKLRYETDRQSGEVELVEPTFNVWPKNYEWSWINKYGQIVDEEVIKWLRNALALRKGSDRFEDVAMIARVNEINCETSEGEYGFKIEILTARDADVFIATSRDIAIKGFIGRYWWQFILCIIFALWIFN